MVKYSLIMPIYNVSQELVELTKAAIDSIKGCDEFILIDNASPLEYFYPEATTYIRNKKNKGYPASVNQAVKKSKGDYLVIANNDIRVSPNWLTVSKEIFSEDEKIGSVHFRMINYDEPFNLGQDTWIQGKEKWCSSSFFVIRRGAFIGYDESYGLGGYDDWDFWRRVREKGWKTAYTNRASYQHKHSSTQLALDQAERFERDQRSREIYKKKFGEYPEEHFARTYPDQVNIPWLPFP